MDASAALFGLYISATNDRKIKGLEHHSSGVNISRQMVPTWR
jgi:hypothetical protein